MIREQDYYDESLSEIDENFEQEMQAEEEPQQILARKATGEIDLKQTLQNFLKNLVNEPKLVQRMK
jgi:hypothetical protein